MQVRDGHVEREATYAIEVEIPSDGHAPRVIGERLVVVGRGQFVFDSHPATSPPEQDDPWHLKVRVKKEGKGFVGPVVSVISDRPALTQLLEHRGVRKHARDLIQLAVDALSSVRFLDLQVDAMRIPSIPGQTVLGDRGENLSSVLQAISSYQPQKAALIEWVRELTPLDVVDFEFNADQTGRILVTLVEQGGRRTSAYSASDGTLRFLAMIAAFLGPQPAQLYFFEELETGLHPARLHLLMSLVENQTRRELTQVVATTHSPQLLAYLAPDSDTIEAVTLAYRLPGSAEQRLKRLVEIPDARRVIHEQEIARLHATGWLEDAVEFTSDDAKGGPQG
jgi:hypothetical protein